jgi:hypothetical protein
MCANAGIVSIILICIVMLCFVSCSECLIILIIGYLEAATKKERSERANYQQIAEAKTSQLEQKLGQLMNPIIALQLFQIFSHVIVMIDSIFSEQEMFKCDRLVARLAAIGDMQSLPSFSSVQSSAEVMLMLLGLHILLNNLKRRCWTRRHGH